jgi:hypothetical protein
MVLKTRTPHPCIPPLLAGEDCPNREKGSSTTEHPEEHPESV